MTDDEIRHTLAEMVEHSPGVVMVEDDICALARLDHECDVEVHKYACPCGHTHVLMCSKCDEILMVGADSFTDPCEHLLAILGAD